MGTEERDDAYWIGVRDALRMIDTFIRWSKRHPEHAKPIEEFIADGIEAAARKCESCLKRSLGLSFKRDTEGTEAQENREESTDTSEYTEHFEETPPEHTGFQPESVEMPEPVESELPPPLESEPATESISPATEETTSPPPPSSEDVFPDIDLGGDSSGELTELEDVTREPPSRDFTSDFDIEEPHPLVIDSSEPSPDQDEGPAIEIDIESSPESEQGPPVVIGSVEEEPTETSISIEEQDAPENIIVEGPATEHPEATTDAEESGFTWHDYEDMLTPEPESEPESQLPPPPEVTPPSESESVKQPSDSWSPFDEPEEPVELDEDEDEALEEPDLPDDDLMTPPLSSRPEPTTPPPPPPPPEPEETDEERRRRTKLLFFGSDD